MIECRGVQRRKIGASGKRVRVDVGDVRTDHLPSLRKAHPCLALAADLFAASALWRSLELEVQTVSVLASYGLTDRLDVGMVAPFTTLRFSGRRVRRA